MSVPTDDLFQHSESHSEAVVSTEDMMHHAYHKVPCRKTGVSCIGLTLPPFNTPR